MKKVKDAVNRAAASTGHKIVRLETWAGLENRVEDLTQQLESVSKRLDETASQLDEVTTSLEELLGPKALQRFLDDNPGDINSESLLIADLLNGLVREALPKLHESVSWGDRLLTLDKSTGFWADPCFARTAGQVIPGQVLDNYGGSDGMAWRLNTLVWAGRQALALDGDFVECGVFKGDMSWVVAGCLDFQNLDRRFYLYDTFEGFSPDYSSNEDFPPDSGFYDYATEEYQLPELYSQVKQRFAEYANVEVIQGVVPDVLDGRRPERIAYLHLDLNSPAAERGALERLFDSIVPGGLIIFDDYGWRLFAKQKKAADEFMAAWGLRVLELPTGQGLMVKPPAN